jgi:hypothetical protein
MKDAIERARIVFLNLREQYNKSKPRRGQVMWSFGDDDAQILGMTGAEQEDAVDVLVQKGLLKWISSDHAEMSDDGEEVCLHPELLDEYLAPRRAAFPAQNITINADNMQNTQIGHNNTLNVSYTTALTALREQVEASKLPSETKHGWIATIDDMLRHPLMPGIVALTAAALAAAVPPR